MDFDKMARSFADGLGRCSCTQNINCVACVLHHHVDALAAFARRVARAENEACEDILRQFMPDTRQMQNIANAIAARRRGM
jgi:hypothetical protein